MLTAHNENERRNGRQRAYGSGEAAAIDLLREEILPDLHVIDVTIYLRGRASLWTALKGAILFLAIKRPWAEGIVCGDLTVFLATCGAVAECRLWQLSAHSPGGVSAPCEVPHHATYVRCY